MTTKKLTPQVLRGIIAATSQVLAGPSDGECEEDWEDIEAADQWARTKRSEREAARSKRKDPT